MLFLPSGSIKSYSNWMEATVWAYCSCRCMDGKMLNLQAWQKLSFALRRSKKILLYRVRVVQKFYSYFTSGLHWKRTLYPEPQDRPEFLRLLRYSLPWTSSTSITRTPHLIWKAKDLASSYSTLFSPTASSCGALSTLLCCSN